MSDNLDFKVTFDTTDPDRFKLTFDVAREDTDDFMATVLQPGAEEAIYHCFLSAFGLSDE